MSEALLLLCVLLCGAALSFVYFLNTKCKIIIIKDDRTERDMTYIVMIFERNLEYNLTGNNSQ